MLAPKLPFEELPGEIEYMGKNMILYVQKLMKQCKMEPHNYELILTVYANLYDYFQEFVDVAGQINGIVFQGEPLEDGEDVSKWRKN